MIFLMCFLAAFGLGRCLDQIQSRQEIETSINRTISEVERLIKTDSTLPQLSRAEIVEILHNITLKDMDSLEETVENARLDYQRALTVVLPYNSDDKNEDIKNLYTKPPMIQIIPDLETMLPYASIQEEPPVTPNPIKENLISTKYPDEDKIEFPIVKKDEYKNHRTTYREPAKVGSTSKNFNVNSNNLNSSKAVWPTEESILKLINSDNNSSKPKLQIIYSTSVTEKPSTTRMLKSTTPRPAETVKSTVSPTKSTVNVLTSDQWKYFAPPSTTTSTTTTTKKPSTTTKKLPVTTTKSPKPSPFRQKSPPFLPTIISTSSEWPTHPTRSSFRRRPESSSKKPAPVPVDMSNIKMMTDESTPMLFVTPMASQSPEKFLNSTSNVNSTDGMKQTSLAPMRKEVATLLESIGLKPAKGKIVEGKPLNDEINFVNNQGIFATNFDIPAINNTLSSQISGLAADNVDSPSIVKQNTFDNVPKDVRKGVNNLSSDVQLLFQKFGLQTSESSTARTTSKAPTRVSFKTNSWNNFKPLPKSEVKDTDMKDFLARFGLGVADNRNSKAIKKTKKQTPSVIDAVPPAMKNILENIGLITRSKTPRNAKMLTTTTTTTSTTEDPVKMHVFKPHEVLIQDPQQRLKINELLDTVKLVQEGEADVSEVHKIANDLLKTTNTYQAIANPMSLEEILEIYNNDVKNQVKRQESKADLSNDTTTTNNSDSESLTVMIETSGNNSSKNSSDSVAESSIPTATSSSNSDARIVTSSVTTTTAKPSSSTEDPNLQALAESFGGSTAEPDPVLPTPKKSGLYFLVDWNSFLEVGIEGEDKVNLKFAPKFGDRTRFIPVVVP